VVEERRMFGTIWLVDRVLVQVAIDWWTIIMPAPVTTMRTLSLNTGLNLRLDATPVVERADIARNGRKVNRALRKGASEEVVGEVEAGVEGHQEVRLTTKTIVLELGVTTEVVAVAPGLRNRREMIPT
jgi:hypothetical protein